MDLENKLFIKKYYENYKSFGELICLALNNEKIYFTKIGFRHLIYKNNDRRSDFEYKSRLELIKYIPDIIKNSKKYTEYRKIQSREGTMHFWSLEKTLDNKNITLVIRQIESKPKHFFSIMYKK